MKKQFYGWLVCLLVSVNTNMLYAQNTDTLYNFMGSEWFKQSLIASILPSGNQVYLTGFTYSDTLNPNIFSMSSFIAKSNADGSLVWKKNLNSLLPFPYSISHVYGFNVLKRIDNNRIVVGCTGFDCSNPDITGNCFTRPFLYYFNEQGDSVSFTALPNDGGDDLLSLNTLTVDSEGNILAGGQYGNNNDIDTGGVWLTKVSAAGTVLWSKIMIDTPWIQTSTFLSNINLTNDGNHYILSGIGYPSDTAHLTGYAIWKTDTEGNVLWRRNLPKTPQWTGDGVEGAAGNFYKIINAIDGSGFYFIAISSRPVLFSGEQPSATYIYYCGKLNGEGAVQWSKTYTIDTQRLELAVDIYQKPDGDLLFLGCNIDPVLFCTDTSGNVKWGRRVGRFQNCMGGTSDVLYSFGVMENDNIAFGGYVAQDDTSPCWDSLGMYSWLVISDSLGIVNNDSSGSIAIHVDPVVEDGVAVRPVDVTSKQLQVFPNPANDHITVRLNPSANGHLIDINIVDFFGKTLLVNQFQNRNSINIPVSQLPNGIYILQICDKEKIIARKKFAIAR